jgi:hypothetical protein
MAEHYGIAVIPARVRKPKDKPKVEKCVGDIETWIMAALRNMQFFSFAELNAAIRMKLATFSEKPYQKLEGSRKSVFEEYESATTHQLVKLPLQNDDPFYTVEGIQANTPHFHEKSASVENFDNENITTGRNI